ncbi:Major facilitator superfamily domain general substrate transporter [Penicillium concentricum]|uniref:Major facilitator superfamily domain general substrate transporter n=1 Tax=Penicillium concentricum TaxID=293559 RepID=A0A9W9S3Y5_9EURO|nr:Major facilitator superfamily domain general substrate transporter [Penicillium concentricum]KAJ5371566.1 Major facilitator superfamily domain general substrate transporter [Penicillium concentricum]
MESGELDVPGPHWVRKQCDETDSTDDEHTVQEIDDQSRKDNEPYEYESDDYEVNEPYEYDSDYESDGMSLGGEDEPDKEDSEESEGGEDSEDSSPDENDDSEDHRIYFNWVLQTFNPFSAMMGKSQMPAGYFDSSTSGYAADAISREEARGCRTAQFLVHKPTPRNQWQPDQIHEPWEINGDWYLSGICDGTPSRDSRDPTVWTIRNGTQDLEADNVKYVEHLGPDEIAMPFHPWCFDIFCRQSKVQFQRVNVAGLMTWRNAEFDYKAFGSFPRAKEVTSSRHQWWEHVPGSEYLVANPLYVPGLPEILLAAVKNEGSPSSHGSCYEIKSSQLVTNRPSASHHSQVDFLSSLPSEVQLMIIGHLESSDVISLGLTSRAFTQLPDSVWYGLVRKEMPWLWEAWEESECIHSPSPWTILTTDEVKCVVTARRDYARALIEDSYTKDAAEKAAEHRFVLPTTIPNQVKLARVNTDWRHVFMQIRRNWEELKGLRNRQRIWGDVEEVMRRIRKFDP